MNRRSGMTMIEIIFTLVLVGIVATVAVFFMFTGVAGYWRSRTNSESAMRAQLALERIGLELRNCKDRAGLNNVTIVDDRRIQYETSDPELSGTRMLRYDSINDRIFLRINSEGDRVLIIDVDSFALNATTADLDGKGGNEISHINLAFTMRNMPRPFTLSIQPRNFVHRAP